MLCVIGTSSINVRDIECTRILGTIRTERTFQLRDVSKMDNILQHNCCPLPACHITRLMVAIPQEFSQTLHNTRMAIWPNSFWL